MWTRFWFEGNLFFDWVNNPEDWAKVKTAYADWSLDELLDKSREDPSRAEYPKFGLRIECKGDKTLREFFTENGMTP